MSNRSREPRRRPIADFLYLAREQPNVAFGVGLGALAVIAVVVFGIVHFTGGSSHSAAGAGDAGNGGAQLDGSNGATPGGGGGPGSTSTAPRATNGTGTGSPGSVPAATTTAPSSKSGSGTPSTLVPPLAPPPTDAPLLPLPMSRQKWVATPSNIHMKAGALARGWVVVQNLGDTAGTVPSPGCSGPPSTGPPAARPPGTGGCYHAGPYTVKPHRSQKFVWTWHATQSGRSGAPPLAPGGYFFAVGPVSVHVTVK